MATLSDLTLNVHIRLQMDGKPVSPWRVRMLGLVAGLLGITLHTPMYPSPASADPDTFAQWEKSRGRGILFSGVRPHMTGALPKFAQSRNEIRVFLGMVTEDGRKKA